MRGLRVSVVIPTKDRNDLLREALTSVVNQTFSALDITVVDDGRTAATAHLVTSFQEGTEIAVRYVEGEARGASSARNLGASAARGDWIAFLDDDDLWAPDYLLRMVEAIQADIADYAVSWSWFKTFSRLLPGQSFPASVDRDLAIAANPGLTGSNLVISKASFDDLHGFDVNLPVCNDKDFCVRLLNTDKKRTVVRERLVYQRVHAQGQITSRTLRRATGLELYRRKYAGQLTPRTSKMLDREYASVMRVAGTTRAMRLRNLGRQLSTYTVAELLSTSLKVLRRETLYS